MTDQFIFGCNVNTRTSLLQHGLLYIDYSCGVSQFGLNIFVNDLYYFLSYRN